MNKNLPIVAIVGRANVGKSSLFNRLVGGQQAIVAREAGTTRDSVIGQVHYAPTSRQVSFRGRGAASEFTSEASGWASPSSDFWLVDTAGMKDPDDEFEASIQQQIEEATDSADLILVVVEAGTQASNEDRIVAKKALRSKKPVLLIINKSDLVKNEDTSGSWRMLGIKTILNTSATQSRGTRQLLQAISDLIPAKKFKAELDPPLTIALLGRPNVGKSQLFNTLAKKQQAIVASAAGTTRDINTISVRYHDQTIELLDTAGIRRSGKIEVGIEKFSVLRSLQAIEAADVCLLLTDVNEPATALDQKIGGMISEAGKGLIIVASKWDSLLDKDAFSRDKLAPKISRAFDFTPWAPLIFTSSVTGQNVTKIFDLALDIRAKRNQMLKTTELNRWLAKTTSHHPPTGGKLLPKLRYMVQDDVNPPTFRIYGSHNRAIHWSYRRYLDRSLRETFSFEGTPIKIYFIDGEAKNKRKNKDEAIIEK